MLHLITCHGRIMPRLAEFLLFFFVVVFSSSSCFSLCSHPQLILSLFFSLMNIKGHWGVGGGRGDGAE